MNIVHVDETFVFFFFVALVDMKVVFPPFVLTSIHICIHHDGDKDTDIFNLFIF